MFNKLCVLLLFLVPSSLLASDMSDIEEDHSDDSCEDTQIICDEDDDGDVVGGWSALFKEKFNKIDFNNLKTEHGTTDQKAWAKLFFEHLSWGNPDLISALRKRKPELPQSPSMWPDVFPTPSQFFSFISKNKIH